MNGPSTTARARLGGLARSAQYDGQTVTAAARRRFADSFLVGHECNVCPLIEIPPDLPEPERLRRSAVLRTLHYARIASRPRKRRAP